MLDDHDRTYTIEEIEQETGFDRRTIAYYVQEGLLPKVGRRGPRTRYPRPYLDRLLFIKKIRDLQDRGQLGNYTLEDIKEIFDTVPERMIADIVSGKEPLEIAPYGGTLLRRPASLGTPRERIERLRRLGEPRSSWRGSEREPRAERSPAPPPSSEIRPLRMKWPDRDTPYGDEDTGPASPEPAGGRHRRSADEEDAPSSAPGPPQGSMGPPPEDDGANADLFLDLDTPHQPLELRRVEDSTFPPQVGQSRVLREAAPPPRALAALLARLDELAGRRSCGGLAERWTRARVTDDIVLSVRGLDEQGAELLERVARVLRMILEG